MGVRRSEGVRHLGRIEKLAFEGESPKGLTAREAWPAVKKAGDELMKTPAGDVVIYHE